MGSTSLPLVPWGETKATNNPLRSVRICESSLGQMAGCASRSYMHMHVHMHTHLQMTCSARELWWPVSNKDGHGVWSKAKSVSWSGCGIVKWSDGIDCAMYRILWQYVSGGLHGDDVRASTRCVG